MGVPVSKLKSSSQSVTLIVEKGRKSIASKTATTTSTLEQDDLCNNVRLVESRITPDEEKKADQQLQPLFEETATLSKPNFESELTDQVTDEKKGKAGASTEEGPSLCQQQLKYIDDNEASSESGSFRKETEHDLQNDNDSGNASISSDGHSHHEDAFEEAFETTSDDALPADPSGPIRLRRRVGQPSTGNFSFYSTLTNRLSTTSFVKRYSTQATLSSFEQSSLRKLISKLQPGDLIEMRCLCNCLKGGQLRASLNNRQRFRRTLQRQSFHQMPPNMQTLQSMTSNVSTTTKRTSISNLTSVFRRSCISGSMSELRAVNSVESKHHFLHHPTPSAHNAEHQQCTEQFHYVLVHKVEANEHSSGTAGQTIDQTSSVWCFHVRPYQRVALLEDDRHLGVLKHESLDAIVGQFLGEMEERHWQYGRGLKQPKLSVFYQIRNQEKLSQSILKQTLNDRPNVGRMAELLMDLRDSYVRYHRTLCNSEHYATLWRYGIGWSTWANGRGDILRALAQFLHSFSQVSPSTSGLRIQLQGGECLVEQTTNLIHVHCFGLTGSRLEESIRQWIRSQVVIQSRAPEVVLPPLDASYLQRPKPPTEASPDFHSSVDTLPMFLKESEPQQEQDQQFSQPVNYKSSASPSASTSLEDFHQADKETAAAALMSDDHVEEEVVEGRDCHQESCTTDSVAIVCADKSSLSPSSVELAPIMEQSTQLPVHLNAHSKSDEMLWCKLITCHINCWCGIA